MDEEETDLNWRTFENSRRLIMMLSSVKGFGTKSVAQKKNYSPPCQKITNGVRWLVLLDSAAIDLGSGVGAKTVGNCAFGSWLSILKKGRKE